MQDLWQLLQPSKTFDTRGRFEKCRADWCSMNEEQQIQVFLLLQAKKEQAGLNPNPYFALNDAMQEFEQQARRPQAEPTNYNGRELPKEQMAIAKYKGAFGTYTLRDAQLFKMTDIRVLN